MRFSQRRANLSHELEHLKGQEGLSAFQKSAEKASWVELRNDK